MIAVVVAIWLAVVVAFVAYLVWSRPRPEHDDPVREVLAGILAEFGRQAQAGHDRAKCDALDAQWARDECDPRPDGGAA